MYLPALPAIALDLKASTASTQMTLMAFFLTLGVCQIFYGPISDTGGRKPPLYFGTGTVYRRLDRLRDGLEHSLAHHPARGAGVSAQRR